MIADIGGTIATVTTEYFSDGNGNIFSSETITETNESPGPASVLNYRDLGQNWFVSRSLLSPWYSQL